MTSDMSLIGLVIFLSSILQGSFGFAFVLLALPALSLILSLKIAIPLIVLILPLLTGILSFSCRNDLQWRKIKTLLIGALLGVPFGIIMFNTLSDQVIRWLLGILLISYSIYNLLPGRRLKALPAKSGINFGFAGGLLGGVLNTSGPPSALFVTNQCWPKPEVIATLNIYVFSTSLMVLSFHFISGNLNESITSLFIKSLPFMIIGVLLGKFLARTIEEGKYILVLYSLLLISGVAQFLK